MTYRTSIVARNAELGALGPLANSGYARIYSGAQPATPESTASGVLLAELRYASTAFGAAAAGVITANAITADASANATGTAGWYRALKSDGITTLWDGKCGLTASTEELRLNSLAISGVGSGSASGGWSQGTGHVVTPWQSEGVVRYQSDDEEAMAILLLEV